MKQIPRYFQDMEKDFLDRPLRGPGRPATRPQPTPKPAKPPKRPIGRPRKVAASAPKVKSAPFPRIVQPLPPAPAPRIVPPDAGIIVLSAPPNALKWLAWLLRDHEEHMLDDVIHEAQLVGIKHRALYLAVKELNCFVGTWPGECAYVLLPYESHRPK